MSDRECRAVLGSEPGISVRIFRISDGRVAIGKFGAGEVSRREMPVSDLAQGLCVGDEDEHPFET
jgi:hypothetical protein